MLRKFWKENLVFYAAGPGDVVGTFRHWLSDLEDPREHASTYSGAFYQWCHQSGFQGLVISSHDRIDSEIGRGLSVSNRPVCIRGKSGISYHLFRTLDGFVNLSRVFSFRPSTVISTGDDLPTWVLLLLRFVGIQVIRSLHCRLPQRKGFLHSLERRLFRFTSDGFLAVSKEIEADLMRLGINDFTPVQRFYPQFNIDRNFSHSASHKNEFPQTILFVGRIESNKGVFDLLQAYLELDDSMRRNTTLEFVGTGGDLKSLAERVREVGLAQQVFFHGHLDHDELASLYQQCAMIVVPTRTDFEEGFNKVVVEGLLYGRPVIASDQCPSAVEFSEFLEVYEADNASMLRDKIERELLNIQADQSGFYFHWYGNERSSWSDALQAVNCRIVEHRKGVSTADFASISPVVGNSSIFVIAEQCNPQWPSVPRVTYQLIRHVARYMNVTLVTHERNESAIRNDPFVQHAVFVKESKWLKWYYSWIVRLIPGRAANWPLLHVFSYPVFDQFDRKATALYRDYQKDGCEFDCIWALSPILPRYPYRLATQENRAPFILGPVNGGIPFPKGFSNRSLSEFSFFNFFRALAEKNPSLKHSYQHADLVLSGSRFTEQLVNRRIKGSSKSVYFPENGVDARFFEHESATRKEGTLLKLLFVGRLTPYKGADILLHAIAKLKARGVDAIHLRVIGDGPQMPTLQRQIEADEIEGQVDLVGRIAPESVIQEYQQAHAFVFPSIREFGGAVVMEAMASGLPCIIADYGGIGEFIGARCGFKAFPVSQEMMIDFVADGIEQFYLNELLRRQMGMAARMEALSFEWGQKAIFLVNRMNGLRSNLDHDWEMNPSLVESA